MPTLERHSHISHRGLTLSLAINFTRLTVWPRPLIERRRIKVSSFEKGRNRKAYTYLLLRKGIAETVRVTARFLEGNVAELETLRREIKILRVGATT